MVSTDTTPTFENPLPQVTWYTVKSIALVAVIAALAYQLGKGAKK